MPRRRRVHVDKCLCNHSASRVRQRCDPCWGIEGVHSDCRLSAGKAGNSEQMPSGEGGGGMGWCGVGRTYLNCDPPAVHSSAVRLANQFENIQLSGCDRLRR